MFYCIPFILGPLLPPFISVRVAKDYQSALSLYLGDSHTGGPKAAVENSELLSRGLEGGNPALNPRFPWVLNA